MQQESMQKQQEYLIDKQKMFEEKISNLEQSVQANERLESLDNSP